MKDQVLKAMREAGKPVSAGDVTKMVNPKVLFPYHYGDTDVTTIPAQLPATDVRIRHYE